MKLRKTYHIYGLYVHDMAMKSIVLMILILTMQFTMHAQATTSSDFMRSTGKIYVVAAVTIVILLALFVYLLMLDRKITRLEKRQKNE